MKLSFGMVSEKERRQRRQSNNNMREELSSVWGS